MLQHRDTAYGLTLIWALVAVYEKTGSPMVSGAGIFCRDGQKIADRWRVGKGSNWHICKVGEAGTG